MVADVITVFLLRATEKGNQFLYLPVTAPPVVSVPIQTPLPEPPSVLNPRDGTPCKIVLLATAAVRGRTLGPTVVRTGVPTSMVGEVNPSVVPIV